MSSGCSLHGSAPVVSNAENSIVLIQNMKHSAKTRRTATEKKNGTWWTQNPVTTVVLSDTQNLTYIIVSSFLEAIVDVMMMSLCGL